jgi:pilus assembly protein CpaB
MNMKNTAQKLILISFVLALIASVTVFFYLKSLNVPDETTKNRTVLVATEAIPPRTLIEKKMLKEILVPDNSFFANYITDSSKIVGKYTQETILPNEGFFTDKLLDKNEDELSIKIANNYRAISINATGDSGVSALLKPGDFVDIISYVSEKKDGAKVIRQDTSKIILQKIEVLALDKQLNREAKVDDKTADNENKLTNFLVTLSISTSDIEKLVLAESIGSIKLALRPLKDGATTKTNGTTWEQMNITSNGKNSTSTKENVTTPTQNNNSKKAELNKKPKTTSYTVKPGDTLKMISKAFYGYQSKYTIIMKANNIKDQNLIFTGQVIKIPVLK